MKPQVRKPTDQEKQTARSWPIWTKEISEFPWSYDEKETCYVLDGEVTIVNEQGEQVSFRGGDWVVFPEGMKCTWKITQSVRKHYNFG